MKIAWFIFWTGLAIMLLFACESLGRMIYKYLHESWLTFKPEDLKPLLGITGFLIWVAATNYIIIFHKENK